MNPLVEDLLHAYVREFRSAGDADPMPYLDRLEGDDREELIALIDGFLATEPPPAYDAVRMAALRDDPVASRAVDRLASEPLSLLEARQSAHIGRDELIERLASALGLAGRERAVTDAYHEIEAGLVAPANVREPVWTALASILRTSAEKLREIAVRPLPPAQGLVFARTPSAPPAAVGELLAYLPTPPHDDPDEAVVRAVFFT